MTLLSPAAAGWQQSMTTAALQSMAAELHAAGRGGGGKGGATNGGGAGDPREADSLVGYSNSDGKTASTRTGGSVHQSSTFTLESQSRSSRSELQLKLKTGNQDLRIESNDS